ncbi:hypothetical protein DERP_006031 [Dermatophagoides pteronyssinus]|uniref:Uncharacterized protein n=1 Tax=Dermatophagoides pteronyssinus TaxID=6956 RepID=A0ABQ8JS36_DERPT|nr:hypothetical protein DERP_006031 [Dermatophagoides pteronyssinus]
MFRTGHVVFVVSVDVNDLFTNELDSKRERNVNTRKRTLFQRPFICSIRLRNFNNHGSIDYQRL